MKKNAPKITFTSVVKKWKVYVSITNLRKSRNSSKMTTRNKSKLVKPKSISLKDLKRSDHHAGVRVHNIMHFVEKKPPQNSSGVFY